jgi:hypothetical protein
MGTGPAGSMHWSKIRLLDNKRWGFQLQEAEDRKPPAATTWAAEFLLRAGESREF